MSRDYESDKLESLTWDGKEPIIHADFYSNSGLWGCDIRVIGPQFEDVNEDGALKFHITPKYPTFDDAEEACFEWADKMFGENNWYQGTWTDEVDEW